MGNIIAVYIQSCSCTFTVQLLIHAIIQSETGQELQLMIVRCFYAHYRWEVIWVPSVFSLPVTLSHSFFLSYAFLPAEPRMFLFSHNSVETLETVICESSRRSATVNVNVISCLMWTLIESLNQYLHDFNNSAAATGWLVGYAWGTWGTDKCCINISGGILYYHIN